MPWYYVLLIIGSALVFSLVMEEGRALVMTVAILGTLAGDVFLDHQEKIDKAQDRVASVQLEQEHHIKIIYLSTGRNKVVYVQKDRRCDGWLHGEDGKYFLPRDPDCVPLKT